MGARPPAALSRVVITHEQPGALVPLLDRFDEARRSARSAIRGQNGRRDARVAQDPPAEKPAKTAQGEDDQARREIAAHGEGRQAARERRPRSGAQRAGWPSAWKKRRMPSPKRHGDPGKQPALLDLPREGCFDSQPRQSGNASPGRRVRAPRQRRGPRGAVAGSEQALSVVFRHRLRLNAGRDRHARRPHAPAKPPVDELGRSRTVRLVRSVRFKCQFQGSR